MKIFIKIFFTVAILFTMGACQKYNQIDNTRTIKTPYTLLAGCYTGQLFKTNDALYFSQLHFPDHAAIRQVLVADTVIAYLKQNFY